jgi:peptidoglycan-associated lipoprotein
MAPPAENANASQGNEKDPNKGTIRISDEIRKKCGITDEDAYFSYNSAYVDHRARGVLQKLAKCFKDGPLRGRTMLLVGHADPRGDDEYNLVLGGRRADSVRGMLLKYGLGKDKITTSSRGEMDADGTDPKSWAEDRRVDVKLGS